MQSKFLVPLTKVDIKYKVMRLQYKDQGDIKQKEYVKMQIMDVRC